MQRTTLCILLAATLMTAGCLSGTGTRVNDPVAVMHVVNATCYSNGQVLVTAREQQDGLGPGYRFQNMTALQDEATTLRSSRKVYLEEDPYNIVVSVNATLTPGTTYRLHHKTRGNVKEPATTCTVRNRSLRPLET